MKRLTFKAAIIALALVAVAPSVGHSATGDTLQKVKARGELNCTSGDGNFQGFFEVDDKGNWHGVDIDYCRAVGVAILGPNAKVKLTPISWAQRFPSLQSGDLDLVIKATGWTFSRDTELGIQFSRPYFLGATQFMVHKAIGAKTMADLDGGTICTAGGTSTERLVADFIKTKGYKIELVSFEKNTEASAAYFSNRCDAIAEWGPVLAARRSSAPNPADHVIMPEVLALEPESVAMRQGDDQWVDVVNWVLSALMTAEENGVTSKNVDAMKAKPANTTVSKLLGVTPGIGARLGLSDDWVVNVLKAVGNTEEIYDRNLGQGSAYKLERGINGPWQKGGLFYPLILD